jgi:hypothetical protein
MKVNTILGLSRQSGYSNASRPGIPTESGHPFRGKLATEADRIRPACLVQRPKDSAKPRRLPSRFVSKPRSSGCKYIILYAPQEELGLYHRSNLLSSSSPLFDVRISAAEIAGIMFRPAALGQGLERLPTGLPQAGLLPGAYSGMGAKVSPAKLAALKHPSPTP